MARPTNGIPRQLVIAMLPLQDGRCWWHGGLISDGDGQSAIPTIEHLLHVSKGGTNHVSNIVIACRACNSARGNADGWVVHPNLSGTARFALLNASHHDLKQAMRWGTRRMPTYKAHVLAWRAWAFQATDCPKAALAREYIIANRQPRQETA